MTEILLVVHSLEYSGPARQLCLVAGHLPHSRFKPRVVVLGTASPWCEELRARGIDVEVLGWRRPIEFTPFLALRRLLRSSQQAVVHAWGITALRSVVLCGGGMRRLVASAALPTRGRPRWFDRWLLRRTACIVAAGPAESARWQALAIAPERLREVPPGVPLLAPSSDVPELPGVQKNQRVILGIGPLTLARGYRDAVYAADMLHYLERDACLVLAGDGPDRLGLLRLIDGLDAGSHVMLAGAVADLAPYLRRAEMVVVPSHAPGGAVAALEAMAAGKPVIGYDLPHLREVVVPGVTGLLTPPGDKMLLARTIRQLLEDPARREQLGAAGRQRAVAEFSVERFASDWAAIYESIGSPART
jgi:glycosyltransferase involved in cell wall biosynthesis